MNTPNDGPGREQQIFRKEAVEAYGASRLDSPPLHVLPSWARWIYVLLVAAIVIGLVAFTSATVPEYVHGTVVIADADVGLPPSPVSAEALPLSAILILPGQRRPSVQLGQEVRVDISEFPDAHATTRIDRLDVTVRGQAEIRQFPGVSGLLEGVRLPDTIFLATARLPSTFTSRGRTFPLHQGMRGTVRIRVGETPLSTLFHRRTPPAGQ